jgi:hypothetical protein
VADAIGRTVQAMVGGAATAIEGAATAIGGAATAIEGAAMDALGVRDAVEGARLEAERSGLPDLHGGPADAYRHLLITGEIRRRFGPDQAKGAGVGHEIVNFLTRSQTESDARMDNRNNPVVAGTPEFETWEQLAAWARGKIIEAAAHDGDGRDGRVFWYKKQPADWSPDFTNVPITPIEKGGPEHRHGADADDAASAKPSPGPSTSADPLERPVAGWTEEDMRAVLNSPAYLRAQHPQRAQAERQVRAWFERRFGTGPVPVDATGRAIRDERATAKGAGACPVAVRAHSRKGGQVDVGAHCRSMPAA